MPEWRNQQPAESRGRVNIRLYNEGGVILPLLTRRIWTPSATLRAGVLLFGTAVVSAQTLEDMMRMQRGYFRGEMVRWEGTASAGDLIAKNADGELYACGYDSKTFVEMARAKITVAKLVPGDPLTILADHLPGSRKCYMRIVEVVAPPRPRPPQREAAKQTRRLRDVLPQGDRTLSGLVVRIDGDAMTLRTREGDVKLLIRRDTRFLHDAQSVGVEGLGVNARVSVRAGPTLSGDLQAYQVNWGGIVTVR